MYCLLNCFYKTSKLCCFSFQGCRIYKIYKIAKTKSNNNLKDVTNDIKYKLELYDDITTDNLFEFFGDCYIVFLYKKNKRYLKMIVDVGGNRYIHYDLFNIVFLTREEVQLLYKYNNYYLNNNYDPLDLNFGIINL